MKLSAYLKARKETQSDFAARADVFRQTVHQLLQGKGCSATTALRIIRASEAEPTKRGGVVTLEDLCR